MKIGFTCGVFDLFHAGHVLAMKESKMHCDWLIVGIEADPTLYKPYKNKPVQTVEERKIQILGCKYVDEVFVYHSGEELLNYMQENKHRIDIRLLGFDWYGKDFIGKEILPCVFTSRNHHYSSSELRQRILNG
jgi:glycerol-3-phosphate cytidylyltransferase